MPVAGHLRADWRSRLEALGIDPAICLREGSPCAVPGVRRYAGSAEIALFGSGPSPVKRRCNACRSTTTTIRNIFRHFASLVDKALGQTRIGPWAISGGAGRCTVWCTVWCALPISWITAAVALMNSSKNEPRWTTSKTDLHREICEHKQRRIAIR